MKKHLISQNRIASIVGVRPNFVKLAALNKRIPKSLRHIIIHTGQHYDYELSKTFFDCLELPHPDFNIGVGSGTPGFQIGEMIKRIENVLLKEKPEIVIVYGDCNSTFAGALAAVNLHIKIAHVEAGYRSYDKYMPEEINRVLTDQISDLLFAPTDTALQNLKKENVQGKTYLTGDIMVDVLLDYRHIAEEKSRIIEELNLSPKEYLVLTFHRERNTESKQRIARIIDVLQNLKDFSVVLPMHPRTKERLKDFGFLNKLKNLDNVLITPPLNYIDFIKLAKNAVKIITDSGGVQKEAYVLGIPCITLRDTTECVETVEEGWNLLVDSDSEKIVEAIRNFHPHKNSKRVALGEGLAAKKITALIKDSIG